MKRTLLLFFTLVVAVSTMNVPVQMVRNIAYGTNMTTEEVQACINNAGLMFENLQFYEQLEDSDDLQSLDIDGNGEKIGCFVNCLLRKKEMVTGTQIDVEKVKKMVHSPLIDDSVIHIAHPSMDTCADHLKSHNECEATIKFLVCFMDEMRRRRTQETNTESCVPNDIDIVD
ncbi:PREDICTED: uncharacterized protein LOC106749248 [Dinoponera quadriceps]|uniref:Uncharacterized protein LOC106749248 n=1 Tax=Dinoponera quadriceps TaxID=609295 RepID=A0A6P3XZT7_DINQU|nr:PREDICTED: uncharacterized protein LOC106749248 [Dinoponera quadriceps]